MQPGNAGASKPLDAERARLRAAGYTEAEISQILIARASAPAQAPGATGQPVAPGVFSGTLGNVGAAMSYGRSFLPTLRGDLVKTFDRALSPIRRIEAALFLAFKVAVIAVIAYAVKQEWDQHIISATETAAQQAKKMAADARQSELQTDLMSSNPERELREHETSQQRAANAAALEQKDAERKRLDALEIKYRLQISCERGNTASCDSLKTLGWNP
jgi:hypothetical protein